jgi:hypothetical protein
MKFGLTGLVGLLTVGMSAVPAQAIGSDTITLNGWVYQCPSVCVVSYSSDGWHVTDKLGGVVYMWKVRTSKPV